MPSQGVCEQAPSFAREALASATAALATSASMPNIAYEVVAHRFIMGLLVDCELVSGDTETGDRVAVPALTRVIVSPSCRSTT